MFEGKYIEAAGDLPIFTKARTNSIAQDSTIVTAGIQVKHGLGFDTMIDVTEQEHPQKHASVKISQRDSGSAINELSKEASQELIPPRTEEPSE